MTRTCIKLNRGKVQRITAGNLCGGELNLRARIMRAARREFERRFSLMFQITRTTDSEIE